MFQRCIQGLDRTAQCIADGLTNRRTDYRKNGVDKRLGVFFDRCLNRIFHRRRQRFAQLVVLPGTPYDGIRQHIADLIGRQRMRMLLQVIQILTQLRQLTLLPFEDQTAQLIHRFFRRFGRSFPG